MFRPGWFLLLFLGFFVAFSISKDHQKLAIVFGAAPAIGYIVAIIIDAQRGARENSRGLLLLTEGRCVEALAAFESAAVLMPLSAIPRYNVGNANVWLWKLEEARTQIQAATEWMSGAALRSIAVPTLAYIAAIQNTRPRADELNKEIETLKIAGNPVVLLAQAVWFAREEKWGEVMRSIEIERVRVLGGPTRAFADALRAWAMVKTGQPLPPIDRVGVFGETGPDALKKWWPEFTEFLKSTA